MSRIRLALLWLAALAGSAGLFWPAQTREVLPGAAAILIFDVSQSMNVQDLNLYGEPVSRLQMARAAAIYAVDNLPCGTALGTGIFAAHRSLLLTEPVEVCQHRGELRQAIRFIDPTMAWHGNSEVAKAYYATLKIASEVSNSPAAVFMTDGHEAPPVSPLHRPRFDKPAQTPAALIAGLGGLRPVPIPKSAPSGRAIGFWRADEVMQIDRYKTGRGGSSKGEKMVELPGDAPPDLRLGGTPGMEHMSAQRQSYLRLLASETGARYRDINKPEALLNALESVVVMPGLSSLNARRLCAALALLALTSYFAVQLSGISRRSSAP